MSALRYATKTNNIKLSFDEKVNGASIKVIGKLIKNVQGGGKKGG